MMMYSGQKSQITRRSSYLTASSYQSPQKSLETAIEAVQKNRELRKYPTESQGMLNNKTENRYHTTVLNKSRDEHIPQLSSPSKIFQIKEKIHTLGDAATPSGHRKNQSLGNIYGVPESSRLFATQSKHQARPTGMRLDSMLPLKDLNEIARRFDHIPSEEIRQWSRSYVNELVHLSQSITKVLKHNK